MNQQQNPFEEAIKSSPETNYISETEKKVQTTNAEDLVGVIATLYKIIYIALGILFFALLWYLADAFDSFWLALLIVLPLTVLLVVPIVTAWASLRITVNMSRNIFVIKDVLLAIKNDQTSKTNPGNAEPDNDGSANTSV